MNTHCLRKTPLSSSALNPNSLTAPVDFGLKPNDINETSFPKTYRLRKRKEFLKTQRVGKRLYTAHFIVYVCKNRAQTNRLGLTVSKKVGKANYRNQVKRRIREAFRQSDLRQGQGFDISVIAKQEASDFKLVHLLTEFNHLARQVQSLSFSRASTKTKGHKMRTRKPKSN